MLDEILGYKQIDLVSPIKGPNTVDVVGRIIRKGTPEILTE